MWCFVQVEFWRKGASHQDEQWQQQQQQYHEQDWLDHDRGRPVDTAHEAVDGSGDMMTHDMARCTLNALAVIKTHTLVSSVLRDVLGLA
jgi:hypothetical protein